MKVLDRYIVRELIFPILYSCMILIVLVLIVDLFNNLDEFLRYKVPPVLIGKYFLSLVPYTFIQILPWAAWLGTLFLLVTFGIHNEIIAMKAAGLKITSIVKPVFFVGFLFGIISFVMSDRAVPKTYRFATDLKEVHIANRANANTNKNMKNVTYLAKNGQLYYFRAFSPPKGTVEDIIGLWLDPTEANTRRKMIAKRGKWLNDQWVLEDVTEYHMDTRGRILGEPKMFPQKVYAEMNFSPKQLRSVSSESTFLSYKELKDSIRQLQSNGIRVDNEQVDLQNRLASPWQPLVMMLICVPFLAKTTNRKAIAQNVLMCVGLIFAFNVAGAVTLALGKAGKLFPFLGAWGGIIAFAIGGLMHLDKSNY